MREIEITRITFDGEAISVAYEIKGAGIHGAIRIRPEGCSEATIKKMIQQDLEDKKESLELLEELKKKYIGQRWDVDVYE